MTDYSRKKSKTLLKLIQVTVFMGKDLHISTHLFDLIPAADIYKDYSKQQLRAKQPNDIDINLYLSRKKRRSAHLMNNDLVSVDLIGYVGGLLTTVAFLPQVIKTWRSRSARDLSLAMLLIFTTGVLFWLLYGIALERWPIIIPNTITFILTGTILFFKLKENTK